MRYILKRTNYSSQIAAEYFDGANWLTSEAAGRAYSYDDAVSRVIMLNVLDRCNCYEVVRCPAGGVRHSSATSSLNDDIGKALAMA